MKHSYIETGTSAPLGATVMPGGVNFSVYSRNADLVELLLFDTEDATTPSQVLALDPRRHRNYHYWHAFVPGLRPGQIYGFRAAGPYQPERGLRFDGARVLLDPYGRGVSIPRAYSRLKNDPAGAIKSIVTDPGSYDGRVTGHSNAHSSKL